jgi:hypothetical protein
MRIQGQQPGKKRAATLVVLVWLIVTASAGAQLSPGPLSRPHKQLNGMTHCVDCHSTRKGEFACLDCHKEIAGRLSARRGFHATAVKAADSSRDCRSCHVEHKGEDTSLVQWKPALEKFDHSKTGYLLEGKHAALACNRCHAPEHIAAAEKKDLQVKDLKRTFLGLRRDCLSCHADQHRGQLNAECQRCHTFAEWKKPPGFDHEKTRFQRTGAHLQVACHRCHQAAANGTVQYVNLMFSRCVDCHRDPHRNAFPNPCESCHNPSGWKHTNLRDKFSHTQTKYVLQGKHLSVECIKCHAGGDFKRPIACGQCSDCHKPDPHTGQFAKRGDRGECSACHTVEGFKPARFGVREHAATAFPLQEKHASVACAKCHVPAGRATVYRVKFGLCSDCHREAHQQQFAGAPHFNRCDACHTTKDFRSATFTIARHEATRFPLTGGHIKVACTKCHKPEAASQLVRYRFDNAFCTTCHTDPHRNQFRKVMEVKSEGGVSGCEVCHSTTSWKEMRFAHAVEKFPLAGKHRAAECGKCHKPSSPGVALRDVNFREVPERCEKCHEEVHGRQFAGADGVTPCAECHNSVRWAPSLFDHNRRAGYPLPGKHGNVKCAECHKNLKLVQGKKVLFFKPTPKECGACHRNPV